ncbi:MAG: hypothetical protein V3T31_04400, partial [candidate division Zixibacteria bacterium]
MKVRLLILLSLIIALMASVSALADQTGRIYGKITTVDGDILEGPIRWDKNEASWVDVLDGTKDFKKRKRSDSRRRKYSRRGRNFQFFGITIGDGRSSIFSSASSGIRFGHIESMIPLDDDRAELLLKSGESVIMTNGSTDIGSGVREIVIEDESEGELELVWDDIEQIDFYSGRSSESSGFGERLYGTMTTRDGETYEGFVCWDVDELFTSDILDGEDKRKRRKIKFGKIESIERYSSNAAMVVLKGGSEMVLRGTNDVDSDNKGIIIADPA